MYKKVYQGSLSRNISILLFQKLYKKVPQNGENAYLVMKYPRASGALRWAPDPTLKRARFTRTMLLCTVGNLGLSRSGAPPDQILDPPLPTALHKLISRVQVIVLLHQESLHVFHS